MSVPASIVALPLLFFFSLPLAFFAVFTTSIAFWALLFRVSVIYLELLTALLRAYIFPITPSRTTVELPPRSPTHKKQSSSASESSIAPPSRPPTKSESFACLVGEATNRDFEGVGGWRDPGSPQEEALWLAMNSRLELPLATPGYRRHHQRSSTGGSLPVIPRARRLSGAGSPLLGRIPGRKSGTASPESYFSVPVFANSSGALGRSGDRDSRVSFGEVLRTRRSSSGSSSGVSLVSMNLSKVRPPEER